MSEYTLSVVQLCPDAYRAAANAVAEAAGYGPDNLSVQLRTPDGAVWWGCHAWWTPASLGAATLLEAPTEAQEALQAVQWYIREGGEPGEHWRASLEAAGLSVYVPEEV